MNARILPLLVVSVAWCGLAQAAPAPFQKTVEVEHPEVTLTGWLPDARLAAGAPSVITRQSDYESVTKAYGIAAPPRVDFRTHFVFVHVATGYGEVRCEIGGNGDLRAISAPIQTRGLKCGLALGSASNRYLIRSYRRSAVKAVNGVSLPRK